MLVLDGRKYAPEGDDGAAGGSSDDQPTEGVANPDHKGSKPEGSGKKGNLQAVLDDYKKDLSKWKSRARENEKRLKEYDDEKAAAEEKKLLEQERYKELLEKRDAQIAELEGKHNDLSGTIESFKQREIQGQKLQAFLDGAEFSVDSKYMGFIDIDKIKIDEQGQIDSTSVNEVRELFLKEHPSLIQKGSKSPKFSQPGTLPSSQKVTRQQNLLDYVRNPKLAIERASQGLVE